MPGGKGKKGKRKGKDKVKDNGKVTTTGEGAPAPAPRGGAPAPVSPPMKSKGGKSKGKDKGKGKKGKGKKGEHCYIRYKGRNPELTAKLEKEIQKAKDDELARRCPMCKKKGTFVPDTNVWGGLPDPEDPGPCFEDSTVLARDYEHCLELEREHREIVWCCSAGCASDVYNPYK